MRLLGISENVLDGLAAFDGLRVVFGQPQKSPVKVFLEDFQNLQAEIFCKCYSISRPENAKAFTKSVNAVRFL